jgi:hypothetical protein
MCRALNVQESMLKPPVIDEPKKTLPNCQVAWDAGGIDVRYDVKMHRRRVVTQFDG